MRDAQRHVFSPWRGNDLNANRQWQQWNGHDHHRQADK